MDWGSVLGALVGALVGGGLTALITMRGWRRERAWQDAEVIADVRQLLQDISPEQRAANVNPAPGAEDELWKSLRQRRGQVCRRLLVLSVAHPSADVRAVAGKLEGELTWAVVHSQWHVSDMLRGRDTPGQFKTAQECHSAAVTTSEKLDSAVRAAAQGKDRGWQLLRGARALRRRKRAGIAGAPRQP